MKYLQLNKIKQLYFGYKDISKALGITLSSARVSASRYTKSGLLLRLKRNIYVLAERWKTLEEEEKFIIANLLQVPSYISFMTAMGYHEITTQLQQDFIESVAIKRTKEVNVYGTTFNYNVIRGDLYFGFRKEKRFFIATKEKAFLDAFYLMSLGRYKFDLTSIDPGKLDAGKLKKMAEKYPKRMQKTLEGNGYFKKT